MAEDNDVSREDRTHPASERRLQQARENGNIPRSRDLGHALTLGAAFLGLSAAGPWMAETALSIVRGGLRFSRAAAFEPQRAIESAGTLGAQALSIVLPVGALLAAAGVVAAVALGGLVLTTKPLMPDVSRVSPMAGLGRIFSRDGAIDLVKLLALAAVLAVVSSWFVRERLPQFVTLAAMPLGAALGASGEALHSGLAWMVGLLVLAALIDAPLQWFRHRARLRMTLEELKREAKESDGDPHVKAQIRARQREMSRSRMLAAVPSADVVVTNPTHFAVALRYDEAGMSAPRVVAKGADHLAGKIRDAARDAGVPLLEAPPLARALYKHAELDRDIPVALYSAVAQVLAYVWQLRHFVPGRGAMPRAPHSIEVPAGLDPQQPAPGAARNGASQ